MATFMFTTNEGLRDRHEARRRLPSWEWSALDGLPQARPMTAYCRSAPGRKRTSATASALLVFGDGHATYAYAEIDTLART